MRIYTHGKARKSIRYKHVLRIKDNNSRLVPVLRLLNSLYLITWYSGIDHKLNTYRYIQLFQQVSLPGGYTMNARIKAYAKQLHNRMNELCCAWEIGLELENETDITGYIDGLRSHKEDCTCLELIANELETINNQIRLDLYVQVRITSIII